MTMLINTAARNSSHILRSDTNYYQVISVTNKQNCY